MFSIIKRNHRVTSPNYKPAILISISTSWIQNRQSCFYYSATENEIQNAPVLPCSRRCQDAPPVRQGIATLCPDPTTLMPLGAGHWLRRSWDQAFRCQLSFYTRQRKYQLKASGSKGQQSSWLEVTHLAFQRYHPSRAVSVSVLADLEAIWYPQCPQT